MKRVAISLLVLSLLLPLAGCSSRYIVVTSDYAVHVATTKPELDGRTDTFTFKDEAGALVSIPRKDLKQIRGLND